MSEHADPAEAELFKDRPAVNELPKGAVRVAPYKPNREQRRKQAALKRKKRNK